jgi:hypothetical protein
VPRRHRNRQPSFEHRRHAAKEPGKVVNAHVERVVVAAVEPEQRWFRDGLVERVMLAEHERQGRGLLS